MVKSIVKELVVLILLLIAIFLALGILFYDYIPANKVVPIVEEYATSTNITEELAEKITEEETVIVTYQIDSTDLDTYESTNEYTKGKVNPFSSYDTSSEEDEDENTTTNTSSGNTNVSGGNSSTNTNTTNTTSNSTTNTNEENTFYKSTGTK